MGTLSLIFGIIVIGVGLYHAYDAFVSYEITDPAFIFSIGIAVIALAIGSALIIKYDSDRKKEKNS